MPGRLIGVGHWAAVVVFELRYDGIDIAQALFPLFTAGLLAYVR
jgi:hypothetical protein